MRHVVRIGQIPEQPTSDPRAGVLATATAAQAIMGPVRDDRILMATATLATGLGSFISLMLFATNYTKAGYALGAMTALTGAVVGAVRIYTEIESQ